MEAEGAAAAAHAAALAASVPTAGAHGHGDVLAAAHHGSAHAGTGTVDNARGHHSTRDHPTACAHADAGAAGGPGD
jgi:hypothetical protein